MRQILRGNMEVKGGVGDTSNYAMVALFPSKNVAQQLRVPGGESPDEMHVTLAFLGEVDKISDPDAVRGVVQDLAKQHGPLAGVINGIGRFIQTHKEGMHAVYASPDLPGLPSLRQALVDGLEKVGMPQQSEHGFVPHITLSYVRGGDPTPEILTDPVPVEFSGLSLVMGDIRTDYPLGGGK